MEGFIFVSGLLKQCTAHLFVLIVFNPLFHGFMNWLCELYIQYSQTEML